MGETLEQLVEAVMDIAREQSISDAEIIIADRIRKYIRPATDALKPFAAQVVRGDSTCHVGIMAMEHCCRCGPILDARAALLAAEGDFS